MPNDNSIFLYGFDKSLNRNVEVPLSSTVYNQLDTTNPNQITSADLNLKSLTVGKRDDSAVSNSGIVFAPFSVTYDGFIRRVATIQLASASDLGNFVTVDGIVNSIEPGAGTKAIWANASDIRYQCIGSGIHQFRGNSGSNMLAILPFGEMEVLAVKQSITNSSANSIVQVTTPNNGAAGGTIDWRVYATDGTDFQTRTGRTTFAAVNKGGTYTTDVDEIGGSVAVSAGTLTATWGITTGTNLINLQVTPTSSLTPTTLEVFYTFTNFGATGSTARF